MHYGYEFCFVSQLYVRCWVRKYPVSIQHSHQFGSKLRLCADDGLLYYRKISQFSDSAVLRVDLNELQVWERKWIMKFSPEKCFTLRVTNKTKPINTAYFITGRQLDPATDYLPKPKHKQSGNHGSTTIHTSPTLLNTLVCTSTASFRVNHHVDAITKKASSTMWFLNRNTARCSRDVKEYCYQTYVRPQLEYASTVWSLHIGYQSQHQQIGDGPTKCS